MGHPPRAKPRTARYTGQAVALEIANRIELAPRGTHSRLATHLGMKSQQLTHKLRAPGSKWSLEDLSAIADFFDAPPGWPLLGWAIAKAAFGRNRD